MLCNKLLRVLLLMDISFQDLKKKKVVNILDGKVLGYIIDIIFDFPEGKIQYFVCGDKKPIFKGVEYKINLCCINKIGDDAVLVSLKERDE